MRKYLFIIFAFIFNLSVFSADPTPARMGFYDFNVGGSSHFDHYSNTFGISDQKINIATGLSARMQSSFAGALKQNQQWVVADFLSTEIASGGISSYYLNSNSNIWMSYRFEFGVGGILRINPKNDIGINFILLRFAHDNIAQNQSGSGILFRYRYSSIQVEAGVDARRDRVAGWIVGPINHYPMQFTGMLRYMLNGKRNVGVRYELLKDNLVVDGESFNNINMFRVFYGISF